MKAADIPFAHHIGIEQENGALSLGYRGQVMNHLKTIHAGAQFALAETQSGIYLQTLFPELEGKVIPVLRDARIHYKKPAMEKITTVASADDDAIQTFKNQFDKKDRSFMQIHVDVKDINDVLTSKATFTWFIQAL